MIRRPPKGVSAPSRAVLIFLGFAALAAVVGAAYIFVVFAELQCSDENAPASAYAIGCYRGWTWLEGAAAVAVVVQLVGSVLWARNVRRVLILSATALGVLVLAGVISAWPRHNPNYPSAAPLGRLPF